MYRNRHGQAGIHSQQWISKAMNYTHAHTPPPAALDSKIFEHKVAFSLSCPIKIAICWSLCSTIGKVVYFTDNVPMTDSPILGGFSCVWLPV